MEQFKNNKTGVEAIQLEFRNDDEDEDNQGEYNNG